jgi:hypothetical protein
MVTQGRIVTHVPFEVQGTHESPRETRRTPRGKYAAVDLSVIDTSGNCRLTLAQLPSTQVVGIYSTKPGMLGITHKIKERAVSEMKSLWLSSESYLARSARKTVRFRRALYRRKRRHSLRLELICGALE